jgi:phage-related protein (TIGR01555 family)
MAKEQDSHDIRAEQAQAAKTMQRVPSLAQRIPQTLTTIVMEVKQRADSFRNFVTGFGVVGRDPTTANQVTPPSLLTYPELAALHIGDGLVKRIVDLPAADATRAGWDIDGDPDGKIVKEMHRVGVQKNFREALQWVRLYGGALTILIWDDEMPLQAPFKFNPKKPQRIASMRTHSAEEIWILPTDIDTDPLSPRYELPTYFTIRRVYGPPYTVHWTRVIEWRGHQTPSRIYPGMDVYRRYWGFGIVQAAFQAISDMGLSWNAVSNLMKESVIGKYKIDNLKKLLLSKDYDAIEARMQNLELSKSVLNGVILGENEEYSRDKLEFAGVADVLDRGMMRVSSEVGIPVALLYGRGAAGMNATGEGDARQYYDGVEACQDENLRGPLEALAVWMGARLHPDVPPEEYHIVFRPVWSMSEKEKGDLYYRLAQGDALNRVNSILSPEEIRSARYRGRYSYNMSVPADAAKPPPDIMMLQLGMGTLGDEDGAAVGGKTTPHASASEVPSLPEEKTAELTKVRSSSESMRKRGNAGGPNTGRQQNGVSLPGATKVHEPRAGNSTTGDRIDELRALLTSENASDEAIFELLTEISQERAQNGGAE